MGRLGLGGIGKLTFAFFLLQSRKDHWKWFRSQYNKKRSDSQRTFLTIGFADRRVGEPMHGSGRAVAGGRALRNNTAPGSNDRSGGNGRSFFYVVANARKPTRVSQPLPGPNGGRGGPTSSLKSPGERAHSHMARAALPRLPVQCW